MCWEVFLSLPSSSLSWQNYEVGRFVKNILIPIIDKPDNRYWGCVAIGRTRQLHIRNFTRQPCPPTINLPKQNNPAGIEIAIKIAHPANNSLQT
ncbi:MAG: hypothetical protein LBJ00_13355 [Planctomycetaceae bacterium]|jgi:hypothetical protein|nr:hypothetical protein [Planctomycetaceae bacterium]